MISALKLDYKLLILMREKKIYKGEIKMKKTKFVALALVVALVLTGTAFAWWGETLTMSQTVKTGELDVEFINAYTRGGDNTTNEEDYVAPLSGYPGWVGHEGQQWSEIDVNFLPTTIKADGDKVIAEVSNMYPGSRAQFEFEIQNTGSIPAAFETAACTLKDYPLEMQSKLYAVVGIPGTTEWEQGPAADLGDLLDALYDGHRLDPEDTIKTQVFIYFDRDGDLTSGDMNENDKVVFTLTMDWTQFNKPAAAPEV